MSNIEKYLKHFKTITKHKFYVMKFCFKCGKFKRGLLHDLSKYGITEFCSSAKYFQGTSSPIDAGVKIAEKDKRQEEQIKLLEQSLNEQIQEKQVYMNMLEEERIK